MASEKMVVIQIKDSTVILAKERTSMCGKCPANMFCTGEKQTVSLEVDKAQFDLKVGDQVLVKTPATSGTKIAFVVYTIPTILFVVSLLITTSFLSETISFVISVSAVACYYLLLRLYDKKFRKKFRPQIIQILRD
ncbi:MAG TPA: SoxR reducing system RseC family protein [Pseudothermotoga sp.]|uniref:SoxR reducing system RseC family protein n=1 Tax=Thermotoga profunda TaxID=1508420 RepID=UPI000596C33C|nr:SoxR reducing system RseC family protein [Thermotoga profunda]